MGKMDRRESAATISGGRVVEGEGGITEQRKMEGRGEDSRRGVEGWKAVAHDARCVRRDATAKSYIGQGGHKGK